MGHKATYAVQQPAWPKPRLLDRLVGAGKQDRWHIETIALAALTLFMPFSQSIMLTPFWVPPASAARALR
jgi:hypothetical protein